MDISRLARQLQEFARERDWEQFHSPKNLAMALSVEAAELQEIFQWLNTEQSSNLDAEKLAAAAEEIADVQIYLIRIADKLGIDIESSVSNKLVSNEDKYPVEKVRGSARKYSDYES